MMFNEFSLTGKRLTNQDYVLIQKLNPRYSLYLIADGMGGYELGELAARTVADSILTYLKRVTKICPEDIQKAINKSNLAIRQLKEDTKKQLGATVGGVVFCRGKATCFWVGDVKIYLFHNGNIVFESTPHSLMDEVIKNGSLTDNGRAIKFSHTVTRSIQGNVEKAQADIIELGHIHHNEDLLFICSDGVHSTLEGVQLQQILEASSSVEEAVNTIRDKCATDSKDNFSLISIQNCLDIVVDNRSD